MEHLKRIALRALAAAFLCPALAVPALAAAEAEGGHGGGLPQLDPGTYPSQVFWLAVMFVGLYAFFAKRTLPEISGVLENRKEHIQSDLDTAERITREAESVQRAFEDKLDSARTEAARIVADTEQTMSSKAATALAALRERSEREVATAESNMTRAREDMLGKISEIAADAAVEIAGKLAGVKIKQSEARAVVAKLGAGEA